MQAELGYQFRRLMHSTPHLPWSFDRFKLKSNLKMAAERLKLVQSKLKHQEHQMSKQVAALLKQGEEERARIRCEALLRTRNTMFVLDCIELFCSLLLERIALIASSSSGDKVPEDMQESVATVMYCANRVPVPELDEIKDQLMKRYSDDETFTTDDSALAPLVNSKVFRKVSAMGPNAADVLLAMQEIAKAHGLKLKGRKEVAHYSLQGGPTGAVVGVPYVPVAVPVAYPMQPIRGPTSEKGRVLFANAMGAVQRPQQQQRQPQQQYYQQPPQQQQQQQKVETPQRPRLNGKQYSLNSNELVERFSRLRASKSSGNTSNNNNYAQPSLYPQAPPLHTPSQGSHDDLSTRMNRLRQGGRGDGTSISQDATPSFNELESRFRALRGTGRV